MKKEILLRYFISTAIILLLAVHASYAQLEIKGSAKIDSLQLLADRLSGIQKVDLLNAIAYEWFNFNDEKANEKISEALTLSEKLRYDKGRGEALIYKGIYEKGRANENLSLRYLARGIELSRKAGSKRIEGYGLMQLAVLQLSIGKMDSARLLYQQSYSVLKDSLHPRELSTLYRNWSKYYQVESDNTKEKEYLLRSLRIREKLEDAALLILIYTDLASYFDRINKYDEAFQYLEKAERLMQSSSDENGRRVYEFKYVKASILSKQGLYVEALQLFNELKEYSSFNSPIRNQVTLLSEIGYIFSDLGNYELGLINYYEALTIAEKNNYNREIAKLACRIGWVYHKLSQPMLANDFAKRGLGIATSSGFKTEAATAYNLLGLVYDQRNLNDSSLYFFQQSLALRQQLGDPDRVVSTVNSIGELFEKQSHLREAFDYYKMAFEAGKNSNNRLGMARTFQKLGQINIKLHQYRNALEYLGKAESIAIEINAKPVLMAVFKNRVDLYKATNQNNQALMYFEKYDHLKDSLASSTLTSRIAGLQTQYEVAGKNQEIQILNKDKALQHSQITQQRTIIYLGIGGFAILLISLVLLYRHNSTVSRLNKNIRLKNQEIQAQSEELIQSNNYLARLNEEINKQKEIIQSQANERYRKIFDSALEGIYQSTVEGKYLTMNASMAKIFGYDSPEEMIRSVSNIADQLYADPQDRLHIKNQINEGGKVKGIVLKVLKRNGEAIWIKNNAQVVYDGNGKIQYYEGTIEDITAAIENDNLLIAKNEELFKINSQLERFLYSASHDLRSPVSSILGLINVLRLDVKEETFLNYIAKIETSAQKLDKVIKDIADFSKTSYKNIKCEKIDFKSLIDKVIGRYLSVDNFQKIKLEVLIEQHLPFYCDNDILEVVIENIFRNSITFFDPGKANPAIKIQIQTSSELANIIISDNGIGIDESHIGNIYKMFYRGSDRSKGAGLGLFIVKESLQKIGGSVATESYLGLGTSFHMKVPNRNEAISV